MTVYWAVPLERNTSDYAVQSLLDVALVAGARGHVRLRWPYSRTDWARNQFVKLFRDQATDPQDALVMLDNDHLYPPDVIDRLVAWNEGVVGALAFRRGEPFYPCFFVRQLDGNLARVSEWPAGLIQCATVGTGCIAIRRWVFDALEAAGFPPPFFRYTYPRGSEVYPSEDIYFGDICEQAGIPHHVDCTFEIPHLTGATIDSTSWHQWLADHPQDVGDPATVEVTAVPSEAPAPNGRVAEYLAKSRKAAADER
jgi:hypothetical protein